VGSCWTDKYADNSGGKSSILLESISPSMPSFANSGVMTTGYQSANSCSSKAGATSYIVMNSAVCMPFSSGTGSGSYSCNSTTITVSIFSDLNCQTPTTSFSKYYYPLVSTCKFNGNSRSYSSTSDQDLYTTSSCNVAPKSSSSNVSDNPNTLPIIIGVVVAIVLVILLVTAIVYCWAKSSNGSGGLAKQDESIYAHYPQHPQEREMVENRHSRGSLDGVPGRSSSGGTTGTNGRLSLTGEGLVQPLPVSYMQPQVAYGQHPPPTQHFRPGAKLGHGHGQTPY
jgi:hypothetical protein